MTSRRDFLRATGAASLAAAVPAPALHLPSRARFDLVIRGGAVLDGTGAPARVADVAVTGRKVAALGERLGAGRVELDGRGLAVAPGFIDIHSHADGSMLWYETITRLDLARSTAIVVPSIPLLSLGASFLLLGEVATPRQWAGLALIASGVLAFVTSPHPHEVRERIPSPSAPIAVPTDDASTTTR